jgi:hypothetical protein
MSRREPLISIRRDDLLAFPSDKPPPAVPSTRAILRWFTGALTYRVAERVHQTRRLRLTAP